MRHGFAIGGGTEAAAAVLAVLALVALAGWISGVPLMASWVSGGATMKPVTALCFLTAAVALASERRLHTRIATVLGWIVCGVAILSLAQDLTGIDLRFADWLAPSGAPPGPGSSDFSMAAATAAGFVCGGAAIAVRRHPVWAPAVPALAALVGLVSVTAVLGYAFSVEELYEMPGFGSVSLPTGLGFVALSGALLLHPRLRWYEVSLRVVLGALVAGALLPAFVFMVSQSRRTTAERLTAIEHDGRDLTDKAGILVDRLLAVREGVLRGLAASPALKSGDLASFYEQAKAAVGPAEGAVVVTNRQRRMQLNTALPLNAPLPVPVEIEAAERAFSTGQMQLSGVFRFAVDQKPSATLTLPVTGTDFALHIIIRSQWVSELLRQAAPPGWIIAVADHKGILAGRSRDPERWVGGPASAPAWALTRQSNTGWVRSTSLEGLNIWLSWRRLSSGWTVLAAVNERDLDHVAREKTRSLSLASLIVTLLGLLFAVLAAAAIGGPLARLSAAAQAFGRGDAIPPFASHIREIGGVIAAFDAGARARKVAEAALRVSEERLRTIVDTAVDSIIVIDETGRIESVNSAAVRIFGYTPAEMVGSNVSMLMGEPHRSAHAGYIRSFLDTGNAKIIGIGREVEGRRKDGTIFPADLAVVDWRLEKKRFFTGIIRDISERRRRELQINLLLREVNHRAKNMLGVVQAIARQTAAAGREEFIERFSERIQALAANQDLLVKSQWRGVELRDLVCSQLSHFGSLIGSRIALEGPPLCITPEAAQVIGMALHELATNAGKYGALSNSAGKVGIAWTVDAGGAGKDRFRLSWSESGGPEVRAPCQLGFGTIVISQMPRIQLTADTALDYAPCGITWRMACPADKVLDNAASEARAMEAVA